MHTLFLPDFAMEFPSFKTTGFYIRSARTEPSTYFIRYSAGCLSTEIQFILLYDLHVFNHVKKQLLTGHPLFLSCIPLSTVTMLRQTKKKQTKEA
jgi:hypothetical protein